MADNNVETVANTTTIENNNVNGKDEQIKENGGEKVTDDIESIVLIDRTQYDALSESDKQLYVKYSPSLQSQAYNAWLNAQNQMADKFNQLGPMISKLAPLTQGGVTLDGPPLGLQKMLKSLESVFEATKDVQSKLDSIIQPLKTASLSAIYEIFTAAFQLIGALAGMVYAQIMNPMNMIEAYYTAMKQIDIKALKESFEGETTPNIELTNKQMKELVIPDEEIKAVVSASIDQIELAYQEIKKMFDQAEVIEETMEFIKQQDANYQTALETMSTMGLSWANIGTEVALESMKVEFEKISEIEKGNPYTENANNMSKSVNDMIKSIPVKYIKTSDLEKLKKAQEPQEDKKEEDKETA